jgi:hypothetical protein
MTGLPVVSGSQCILALQRLGYTNNLPRIIPAFLKDGPCALRLNLARTDLARLNRMKAYIVIRCDYAD